MRKLFFLGFLALIGLIAFVSAENVSNNIVACPEDAKICPDGATVERVLPNCEFADCSNEQKSEGWSGLRIASPIMFFVIAVVLIILALKIAKWVLWLAAFIAIAAAIWFVFVN